MNSANKFRVAAIVVAVLSAVYTFASFFADTFSPRSPALPSDTSKIATQTIDPIGQWAAAISPFRADLESNYALAVALMALRPDNTALSVADAQRNADAQADVVRALKAAPYNSQLWLVLALLQTQHNSG